MYVATRISVAGAAASSGFSPSPSPSPRSHSLPPYITLQRRRGQVNQVGVYRVNHRIRSPRRPLQVLSAVVSTSEEVLEVSEIKERSRKWLWRDRYSINYFVQPPLAEDSGRCRPPLVLVHGFGASIPHWRR